MKKFLMILFLMLFFSALSLADNLHSTYQQSETWSKQHLNHNAINQRTLNVLPQGNLPNAHLHSDLNNEALNALHQTNAGQMIVESFQTRPQYHLEKNDAMLQRVKSIEENSTDMINGNGQLCQAETQCTPIYENKTCLESLAANLNWCTEHYQVNVETYPMEIYNITISIGTIMNHAARIYLNVASGQLISSEGAARVHVQISPLLQDKLKSENIKAINYQSSNYFYDASLGGHYNTKKVETYVLKDPKANDLTLGVEIYQKHHDEYKDPKNRGMQVHYQVMIQPQPKVMQGWNHSCDGFALNTQCTLQGAPTCLEGPETRTFSGVQIFQSCWRRKKLFHCLKNTANTCAALRQQNCEQIDSSCAQEQNGQCVLHQQTFRCLKKQCEESTQLNCGSGNTFCLDGNCPSTQAIPFNAKDFNQAVNILGALQEAARNGINSIFKGDALSCRRDGFSYNNCCNDKGWGQDLHLAQCDGQEKQLGDAKEHQLCAYVGEKCSNKVFGSCVQHKKVYCCFHSKLARLVQTQGRAQLHFDFGSGEYPHCEGFTPEQLQNLNFNAMDFTEIADDLKNHIKTIDNNQVQNRLKEHVEQTYQSGNNQ